MPAAPIHSQAKEQKCSAAMVPLPRCLLRDEMDSSFPKSVFILVWDDWVLKEGVLAYPSREEAKNALRLRENEEPGAYLNIQVVEFSRD